MAPESNEQYQLEETGRKIKEIVSRVISEREELEGKEVEGLSAHEYKTLEMEQQIKILKIEQELDVARMELSRMRREGYS